MFHHRQRRNPLADIFDWADYQISGAPPPLPGPGQRGGPGFGFGHGPFGRRRSRLSQVLIGLAILVAVVYLFQRLSGSKRNSWL